MPKSSAFANDVLDLFFNATTIPELAENDTTSPATNLTVALHTASPGTGGDQTTNEATYTSYVRVNVARTSGGWTVTANSVSPVSDITFPEATGGSETITHVSIGTGTADNMIYFGAITPTIAVSTGVTPIITTGTTIDED